MKVTDNGGSPVQLDAYIKQAQQKSQAMDKARFSGTSVHGPNDKVQLSDEARAILQASQASGGQPEVRDDKVQQVKMEIENGTYRVEGQKVATDMLKEGFENNLLLQKINTRA